MEELDDRKLTQLLQYLQQLAGDALGIADGRFLCELFLQWLPSNVRMVLASTRDDTALEDLVAIPSTVCNLSQPTPPPGEMD